MAFVEIVDHVIALLRDRARISYWVLKREFALDDERMEDVKAELIDAQRVAGDEDSKVLVWVGTVPVPSSEFQVSPSPEPLAPSTPAGAEAEQCFWKAIEVVREQQAKS